MDITKAFGNVKHSTLFWKLEEKGIPPIILQLLVIMYSKQQANIKWNNNLSNHFRSRMGLNMGQYCSPAYFVCTPRVCLIYSERKELAVGLTMCLWESLDMRTIFCYYHPPWMDFKKW